MKASYEGHLDVVKTLIEAGANANRTNKVGKIYMYATCTHFPHVSLACIHMFTCTEYVVMMPWVHVIGCVISPE